MKLLFRLIFTILSFLYLSVASAQVVQTSQDICPLLIGEMVPNATLQNAAGDRVDLKMLLNEKPSVLVFYRGGWCPYCNMQLSGLVKIEKEILKLGYQIIAISPDDYRNLQTTESKDKIKYTLLSDPNAKLIQQVGIGFKSPVGLSANVASKGQIGEVSETIPVPTLLILDKMGKILFEYINPNFKERISSEMLLAVLKTLKA